MGLRMSMHCRHRNNTKGVYLGTPFSFVVPYSYSRFKNSIYIYIYNMYWILRDWVGIISASCSPYDFFLAVIPTRTTR